MYQNPDTAIILGNEALKIITPISSQEFTSSNEGIESIQLSALRATTLDNLGSYYCLKTDNSRSLDYYMKALKIDELINNKKGKAMVLGHIGNVYASQGDYPKTLDYYLRALKIDEELDNKIGISKHLTNIGSVYCKQDDFPKALDYYFRSQKIIEGLGLLNDNVLILGNIGSVFGFQGNYSKALDYYFMTLKMAKAVGNKSEIALLLGNIGSIYGYQKDYSKSLDYFFMSLKMQEELGNINGMAMNISNIGSIYTMMGRFEEAEQYLNRAIALEDSIGTLDDLRQTEALLSKLYDTTGRYKEALFHYKKATALTDTLFSQENKKLLIRKEMNYEFDKKEAITKALHDKEMDVAESERKRQQFIIILVSSFLFLGFLLAAFIFRSLRITRKQKDMIELQKNEVSQQKDIAEKQMQIVEMQKEIVEKQKEEIIGSISYAQCIQQRILIDESEIKKHLPNSFIYYQPKDIVSGDFYWFSKIDDIIILAAIDCTGHGVPGAFMSIIGTTLLNEIVNKNHKTNPSEILRLLNLGVYDALRQKKDEEFIVDGMVVALCSIDYKNKIVQFAGAQNPLYVVSENNIEIFLGDMHEIGGDARITKIIAPIKKTFTNHVIPMKKDMCIYLFSDGYIDQLGGADRKIFGTQKFKDLLLSIQHLNMHEQNEIILSAHEEWKWDTAQIDDILVIGVKI